MQHREALREAGAKVKGRLKNDKPDTDGRRSPNPVPSGRKSPPSGRASPNPTSGRNSPNPEECDPPKKEPPKLPEPFVPGTAAARVRTRLLGSDRTGSRYMRMCAGEVMVMPHEAMARGGDRDWLRVQSDEVVALAQRCIPDSQREGFLKQALLDNVTGVKDDAAKVSKKLDEAKAAEAAVAAKAAADAVDAQRREAFSLREVKKDTAAVEQPLRCFACSCDDVPEYMLLCDECDAAFHTFCLNPPLEEVPAGKWFCDCCKRTKVSERRERALLSKKRARTAVKKQLQNRDDDTESEDELAPRRAKRAATKKVSKPDSETESEDEAPVKTTGADRRKLLALVREQEAAAACEADEDATDSEDEHPIASMAGKGQPFLL